MLAFLLPCASWFACYELAPRPKSIGNLTELAIIMISIPVAAALRVILGTRQRSLVASVVQVFLVAEAVFVYFQMPMLPE